MTSNFPLSADMLRDAGFRYLTEDQAQVALDAIYDVLELRVGTALAKDLSNAELTEFEKLINQDNDEGARNWLEKHRSDFRDVVRSEIDYIDRRLRSALAVSRSEIDRQVLSGSKGDSDV